MAQLLERLQQDHRNLTSLLNVFEEQVDVFEGGGRPDYDLMIASMSYFLNYPDLFHHPCEDRIHERMKTSAPAAAETVGDLSWQHEALAGLVRRLASAVDQIINEAEVSRDAVSELAREFLKRYRHHIRQEDNVFFPAAEVSLSAEDWAAIEEEMEAIEDPVFRGPGGEDYTDLCRQIVAWDEARREARAPAQ